MGAGEVKTWTILGVLDWTRGHFETKGMETPRLDAEVLIAHALGLPRVMLYARFDQPLSEEERAKIRALVLRRARGEPIAYITGLREFYSLEMEVSPDVLIPRPDTETLVEIAVARLKGLPAPLVVDVGTGSGCIAAAIAKNVSNAQVFAIDRSPAACALAARNAARHGLEARVTVIESDLLLALPAQVEPTLIAANLPYIPTADMARLSPGVRDFEPRAALDGGPDGLDLIRRLIAEMTPRLLGRGSALLEIGHGQAGLVVELLCAAGWPEVETHSDLAGTARVVEARGSRSG